jgi:hypothetical protein
MSTWDDLRCDSCGGVRGIEEHWTEAECLAEWGRCILVPEGVHHAFVSGEPRVTIVRVMAGAWRTRNLAIREAHPQRAELERHCLCTLRHVWHAVRGA